MYSKPMYTVPHTRRVYSWSVSAHVYDENDHNKVLIHDKQRLLFENKVTLGYRLFLTEYCKAMSTGFNTSFTRTFFAASRSRSFRRSRNNTRWYLFYIISCDLTCGLQTVRSSSSFSRKRSGRSRKSMETVFWCENVVYHNELASGAVVVKGDIIHSCLKGMTKASAKDLAQQLGARWIDLGDSCLSPGLIDVHAHISALGREWEGYETATKAAAAGGITTIMGMPLNSIPPTTTVEALEEERHMAVSSDLYVDVGLWGGVVPGNCNESDLSKLLTAGVFGLKAFLSPLPEAAGFESISPKELLAAAKFTGKHNKPILVHSELMSEARWIGATEDAYLLRSASSFGAHVESRPVQFERDAVNVVCEAASFCHMHIVHLSDSGCLASISSTKADRNKSLTVETCPHYLLFDSSMIPDGNTLFKCFPPIRDQKNREFLWKALDDGIIDIVASDHSPCDPSLRLLETGNMKNAWGGLSGLQYQLPATWTGALFRRFNLRDMAKWWSQNPAMLIGASNKGLILEGMQADLCWWDFRYQGAPNEYSKEYHRWKGNTVYASDTQMRGRVLGTWVRGEHVYDGIRDEHAVPIGRFLLRN